MAWYKISRDRSIEYSDTCETFFLYSFLLFLQCPVCKAFSYLGCTFFEKCRDIMHFTKRQMLTIVLNFKCAIAKSEFFKNYSKFSFLKIIFRYGRYFFLILIIPIFKIIRILLSNETFPIVKYCKEMSYIQYLLQ